LRDIDYQRGGVVTTPVYLVLVQDIVSSNKAIDSALFLSKIMYYNIKYVAITRNNEFFNTGAGR